MGHSRKLEASLVRSGDEDSHKASEIESFSFGQLFLELSFKSAQTHRRIFVYNIWLVIRSETGSKKYKFRICNWHSTISSVREFQPNLLNTFLRDVSLI